MSVMFPYVWPIVRLRNPVTHCCGIVHINGSVEDGVFLTQSVVNKTSETEMTDLSFNDLPPRIQNRMRGEFKLEIENISPILIATRMSLKKIGEQYAPFNPISWEEFLRETKKSGK